MTGFKKSTLTLHSMLSLTAVIAAPSSAAVSGAGSDTSSQLDITCANGVNSTAHPSLVDYRAVLDHVVMVLNKDPAHSQLAQLVSGLSLAMDDAPQLNGPDITSIIKNVDGLSAEIRKPRPDYSIVNLYAMQLELTAEAVRPVAKPVAVLVIQIVQQARYPI